MDGPIDAISRIIESIGKFEMLEKKEKEKVAENKPRTFLGNLHRIQFNLQTKRDLLDTAIKALKHGGRGERGKYDYSALILLCGYGRIDYVRHLLDNGSGTMEEVNHETTDGTTALIVAAEFGYTDIVRLLLAYSPHLNHTDHRLELTALSYAAGGNHLDIARLLLDAGADIECCDQYANPLYSAIRKNHLEMVQLLVMRGADITTALDMLETVPPVMDRPEILEYLQTRKPLKTPERKRRRIRSGSTRSGSTRSGSTRSGSTRSGSTRSRSRSGSLAGGRYTRRRYRR